MHRPFRIAVIVSLLLSCAAHGAVVIVKKGSTIDTIQAGVDAANAGDTVKVKKGVYQENVTISVAKSGISLVGLGKVIVEARPAGGGDGGPGIVVQADGVTIENLTVRNVKESFPDGVGIDATGSDLRVERCKAIACADAGFRTTGGSGARFVGCGAFGCDTGFVLDATQDSQLSDCTISGATRTGLEAGDVLSCAARRCTFVGCEEGIHLQGSALDGFVIDRCSFRFIDGFAISAAGSHVTIRRSRVFGADGGVSFGDTGDVEFVLRDNRIEQISSSNALELDDVAGAEIRDNVVLGAQLQSITADGVPNLTIRGNVVRAAGGRFAARAAIDLSACPDALVAGNRCDDVFGAAFEIDGAGVTLDGNRATNCVGDGFFIRPGATNLEMLDCLARRCSAEGLDHRGTNSVIHDNAFKKCRLDLTNDGTATFTNNKFKTGGETTPHEID